jgi:hypothetical protein
MARPDLPSAADLERILNVRLERGDIEGVGHALRLLTVQDPHRAELLYQTMRVGLAVRTGSAEGQDHFVAVIQDGIDFNIECGLCGDTERNVAVTRGGARQVADAHEQQCTGEDN